MEKFLSSFQIIEPVFKWIQYIISFNEQIIYFLRISQMLFRRLLQSQNDNDEDQLQQMEKQLKSMIQKAKTIASALKSTPQNDDIFTTHATGQLIFPEFRNQVNYNEEFWKTYLKNQLSFALIKELSERTTELQELVKEIENTQEEYFKLYKLRNRKKNRRLAVQIEKKFQCPYQKCYKVYGSDVSLNLHIKLKHNGGNKTDREKLAQEICLAEVNKTHKPQMRLNLPPGYLEDYRKNNFLQKTSAAQIM